MFLVPSTTIHPSKSEEQAAFDQATDFIMYL